MEESLSWHCPTYYRTFLGSAIEPSPHVSRENKSWPPHITASVGNGTSHSITDIWVAKNGTDSS